MLGELAYRDDAGLELIAGSRGHRGATADAAQLVVDLAVRLPGAVVGEMAFLQGEPRSADVRAGENAELLCWRGADLHEALEQDPALARGFYHAAAMLLADRLRSTSGMAAVSGMGGGRGTGLNDDTRDRVMALSESLKSRLMEVEASLRTTPDGPAREVVATVMGDFVKHGGRLFGGLSIYETTGAGEILARELHPYLARSRTVELSSGRAEGGGWAQLLGHVMNREAQGVDAMGSALDEALLGLPTAIALQERQVAMVRVAVETMPLDRPRRVLVMPTTTGVCAAALGQAMAREGGVIVCVDEDREALAFLDSGVTSRPAKVQLDCLNVSLSSLAMGRISLETEPCDLILLDGLLDYLPARVVAVALQAIRRVLAPGGAVVLSGLLPSQDHFVFDHLLGWSTIRRDRESLVELVSASSLEVQGASWSVGAGLVVAARTRGDS